MLSVQTAIEIATFLLVTALSIWAFRSAESFVRVRRRLGDRQTTGRTQTGGLMKDSKIRNPFLQWVQSSTSLKNFRDRNQLTQDLARAGYGDPSAPIWYVVIRFGLALGLPILFLTVQTSLGKPMNSLKLTEFTLLLCGLGLIAPKMFVDNRIRSRQQAMEHEFPDALDLMVVCVEAGLGLEAAFVRVGEEVRESHPRTALEFGRLAQELSAGRSRADALRAMGDRVGVETVRSFVALVIQTDALGVSIGQTLRTYSIEMREHRLLRAEEKAARVPVLMTAPLVICILPVIIASLLLPAIIDVMRTLLPTLKGLH